MSIGSFIKKLVGSSAAKSVETFVLT